MRFVFFGTALSLLCVLGQAAPPNPSVVHKTTANSAGYTTTAKSPKPSKPTPSSSIHPNGTSTSWKNVKCTSQITDATLDPTARWDAADADDALKAALAAWSATGSSKGLKFPEFISNYFTGPDNWDCGDIGNIPCSTVLTCNQVKYPAGYLIMNSFSSIHQLHQQTYNALGDALNAMQNNIGTFASAFAPQKEDNSEIIKMILDTLTMGASIASSYAWNIALKKIASLASSKYFSMGKDVTNAALISFSTATSKDSLSSASNALGTENSISDALGTYFSAWTGMESGYMTSLFSGASDDSSIGGLQELVAKGSMLLLSDQIELTGMTAEAEKVLYGQLIPGAWAVAPTKPTPRILRNAGGCSTSINQDLLEWIEESTMVDSYVCYNNDAYYVVGMNLESGKPFIPLPGGTHSTLDGTAYGGVILEDMVQSSYQAYQLNNNANGYKMPALSKIIDGQGTEGVVIFQNGILTPGFFNFPICDNITAAAEYWMSSSSAAGTRNGEYWPCDPPAGYNSGGTNLHVNDGCINVNDKNLCNPSTTSIADQNTGNSTATIYAKFNGDDKTDYRVVPGCKLDAVWPRSYGDIYFGNDNCLYDSTGAKIFDQCCDESTTDSVLNPYYGN